jgi:drug/metabolite transporter (DMT)-like permease
VVAVTTFLMGIKLIGPTRASVLSTIEPVVTVVLAAILFGESIGPMTVVGGALILAGAIMLSAARSPRVPRVVASEPNESVHGGAAPEE